MGPALKPLIGTAVALILTLTGCGGSSGQAGTRFLETCVNPDHPYLMIVRDFDRAATSLSAGEGSGQALGQVVADVDTYGTDLAVLRPHANADQRAQIDHYEGVLNRLEAEGLQAADGDDQAAPEAWTGVGRRIAKLPALVASICNV